eukprot:CAMPEP_0117536574 /NCGR_PEP_ID=MMETSP0784-20121206/41523_1 /TAXON_ID=39447 /ORGANISM="" /LENGTH=171 /DNA_ID=CAMNT_0005333141 /DNA_START=53 /DNA_END=568 /DNA_ORIENTATION=+
MDDRGNRTQPSRCSNALARVLARTAFRMPALVVVRLGTAILVVRPIARVRAEVRVRVLRDRRNVPCAIREDLDVTVACGRAGQELLGQLAVLWAPHLHHRLPRRPGARSGEEVDSAGALGDVLAGALAVEKAEQLLYGPSEGQPSEAQDRRTDVDGRPAGCPVREGVDIRV